MRFVSIATLRAACATYASASPLVSRAVYAGELVNPKADDTIAIDQQFQFAYLPAVRLWMSLFRWKKEIDLFRA